MFAGSLTQIRISKKGFTLVELLVSMAIIIFMLSIMSQAFVIATTCMSGLKGVGELLDKGRPVLAVLQKDLSAYHFDGNKRLSDADFWDNGPPRQGYFKIYEGYSEGKAFNPLIDLPDLKSNPPKVPIESDIIKENEGKTTDGVTYQRSGYISDHRLAFTSRLSGKNPEDFYVTAFEQYFDNNGIHPDYLNLIGLFNFNTVLQASKNSKRYDFTPGVLHSQWAEIAYFTKANNRTANGTPLMDLYRQQKAVLPSNAEANALAISDTMPPVPPYQLNTSKMPYYENFSCRLNAGNIYFNSPSDLTIPSNRMASGSPNILPAHFKSDLLITDVISFDVRILPDSSFQDFSLVSSLLPSLTFRYNQIQNTLTFPCIFDTWTTGNGGGTQYDIGNFNTGVWQPTVWDSSKSPVAPAPNTGINPATLIPIWNHNRSGMAGNIFTPSKGLRINAIQVSIRLWDEKSQKAREFKIIQRI
jgi:prepilin-type N-terminal cleavage/methylation domain-containing protein